MRDSPPISLLRRADGGTIAYRATDGKSPGVVFLGGFMSDMTGTKASALEAHCRRAGRGFVRFDYFGHGASDGAFRDGTIGGWRDDALAVIDAARAGPLILVGSSMGGWLMLLAALARPERVAGLVGIAAAPDFTEDLMWDEFDGETRAALARDGVVARPSGHGEPPGFSSPLPGGRPGGEPVTMRLIEEARRHLLLRGPVPVACPVHLLHGMADEEVPWRTAPRIAEAVASADVTVELIKDGDHRLSRTRDIARLCAVVEAMAGAVK